MVQYHKMCLNLNQSHLKFDNLMTPANTEYTQQNCILYLHNIGLQSLCQKVTLTKGSSSFLIRGCITPDDKTCNKGQRGTTTCTDSDDGYRVCKQCSYFPEEEPSEKKPFSR